MYQYDSVFYKYINEGAKRSAEPVVRFILQHYPVRSVADFGCGQGAWLAVWKHLGVPDVVGLDGDYVSQDALLISPDEFRPSDLSRPLDIGRQFDLVQSLEVAEHLPETAADTFVDNLARHAQMILFSAAAVGQGGENHINEQPYDYWRHKFQARGYVVLDAIRPTLRGQREVEPWYRYNTFLYVHKDIVNVIPDEFKQHQLDDGESIKDISPPLYKARKLVLKLTPVQLRTWLAIIKKHMVSNTQGRHSKSE